MLNGGFIAIYPGGAVQFRCCFLTAGAARLQATPERAFVSTGQVVYVPEPRRLITVGASLAQCVHRAPAQILCADGRDWDRRFDGFGAGRFLLFLNHSIRRNTLRYSRPTDYTLRPCACCFWE
jgi:hypothetical protein